MTRAPTPRKAEIAMKSILITGASRGLGLALAQALDTAPDVELILAVRDFAKGKRAAASLRRSTRVIELDMGSRASIQKFIGAWREPLHALVNNAGLQFTGPAVFNDEGVEMTLAVNHLGPLELTLGLLPWLEGARVMGIGSGTHNPKQARMFGFRGGHFTSIAALARGEAQRSSDRGRGMDLYATSKLLSMTTTVELARRYAQTSFLTLDPGLMPGTGLVRTAPLPVRVAWHSLLRWLVPLLPDASTPQRSAAAGRRLLLEYEPAQGEIYDFDVKPSRRVWDLVRDAQFGRRLVDESLQFLQRPQKKSAPLGRAFPSYTDP
jgi:NAD(P)-dependent dehydrogenase (short-subunit alcohol dehydrogenase family)